MTSVSASAAGSPSQSSPVGRYDVIGDDTGATELHELRLLGVPVELFLATRQQHDDLVRECAVMGLAGPSDAAHESPALRQLIEELGVRSAAATSQAGEAIEAAARDGKASVDLVYRAPAGVVAGADRLELLMSAGDELCQQGRMLTMPRTPEMQRFASWWLDELRRQVGGEPARRWDAGVG